VKLRIELLVLLLTCLTIIVGCGGGTSISITPANTTTTTTTTTTTPSVPQLGHVFLLIEENHGYASVIGNTSMPYLNSLANKYGLATQYFANFHPSLPNYFLLTTGQSIIC
jgi:phosphatidylinositol-3-phosphatase